MNEKDINLIAEAYNKVGLVQESFNYMDLAKEILHAAEEHINDGVRHTFAEIWSGSKEYDMVLDRYVEDLRELVDIAENLKKGDMEKVKRLYKGLDMTVKDHLPKSFITLADNLSLAEVPEESEE
jgi:hypothetical protein